MRSAQLWGLRAIELAEAIDDAESLWHALNNVGCARLRLFPDNTADVLNQFALYLCLPAAVLRFVPKLRFDADIALVALVPWLVLALCIGLIVPIARALKLRDEERAVLLLCVPLGNTSFLGYPLTEALLGHDTLPYAVIYDQFGSFLILTTWGLGLLARYVEQQ